jgi:hypothetical protein
MTRNILIFAALAAIAAPALADGIARFGLASYCGPYETIYVEDDQTETPRDGMAAFGCN